MALAAARYPGLVACEYVACSINRHGPRLDRVNATCSTQYVLVCSALTQDGTHSTRVEAEGPNSRVPAQHYRPISQRVSDLTCV